VTKTFDAMPRINLEELPWTEQRSPKGKYCVLRKPISLALGGKKDVGTFGGGHPFDVELIRVPPGAINWPYHAHSAQWELYLVVAGQGEVRTPEGRFPVRPGDCLLHPPGEAHQIQNTAETEDLLYYVVADHSPADVTEYPDSGKYGIKPQRKTFVMQEIDYFLGEE
jgi:uncharacterized cupin superfamily protein